MVNECENLNRKRDINYYGNLGLYFLHTTIVFKSQEPNLTSSLSPDAQSGYIIYLNCIPPPLVSATAPLPIKI